MNRLWVLPDSIDSSKYAVVSSNRRPKDAICLAPAGASLADGPYVVITEVEQDGLPVKVASLNLADKAQDQAAEATAAALVAYKEQRKAEYPPIGDQLDALWKKEHLNDDTEWQAIAAEIEAVKARYPKP